MLNERVIEKKLFGGEGISKCYGKKEVLRNLNFSLDNGIVGIFGLNGAGKTTLLRILSGLDGYFEGNLYKTNFEDVAYQAVERNYPVEMRVKDYVSFYGTFYENQKTEEIFRELGGLNINPNSFMFSLSTGVRQYVKFLTTAYSGASVCLFDEPFSNLDINLREKVAKTLIMESNSNRLFIITTHEIKEVEKLIDGFYILNDKKLSPYYSCEEVVENTEMSIGEFYKEKANEKD